MLSGSLKGACGQIAERILYVGDETECDDGADGGQNRAEMDIAIDVTCGVNVPENNRLHGNKSHLLPVSKNR